MAKTIQEERFRWIKPIVGKEMKLVDVVKVCPHSERSLKRWKSAYKKHGIKGLVPKSTRPTNPPGRVGVHKVLVVNTRYRLQAIEPLRLVDKTT